MNRHTSLVISLVSQTGAALDSAYLRRTESKMGQLDTGAHYPRAWSDREIDTLVLDPSTQTLQRLDLFPRTLSGCFPAKGHPVFIASSVGDIDGDGHEEIICAVSIATPVHSQDRPIAYLLIFERSGEKWVVCHLEEFPRSSGVEFIRSIAVGDIDQDGTDEVVIGTRPNGVILLLKKTSARLSTTQLDAETFGAETTNVREVTVGRLDGSPSPSIFAAIAQTNADKWGATPGLVSMYACQDGTVQRGIIDDFHGITHARMLRVCRIQPLGNVLLCNAVGVYSEAHRRMTLPSTMHYYDATEGVIRKQHICSLQHAIKSRGFDAGDVDGDGCDEIIVGTRNLDTCSEPTSLYCFSHRVDGWHRETIDTSTKPMGFHCVKVADVTGDGWSEVIASDDGNGVIKRYRLSAEGWSARPLHQAPHAIFTVSIDCLKGR